MKKRLVLLLCLIMCGLSLMACGKKASAPFEYDASVLRETFTSVMDTVSGLTDSDIEKYLEQATDEFTITTLSAWNSISGELGSVKEVGSINITDKKDKVILEAKVSFEKRDCDVNMVFERIKGIVQPTTTEFSVKYTVGETMAKAGANTLMGMGIVFLVLILISVIISLFAFVPGLLSGAKKKKEEPAAAAAPAPAVTVEETVDESDDLELVAVIAAAIAAYEGTATTDGFVVRSIRRRTGNNWK